LVRENISEEIAKLKQQSGKDMVVFGGAGIVSTFMELRLIDEYRPKVHPAVLGNAKALFKGIKDSMNLKILKCMTFHLGVIGRYYQPDRKEPK
jgi:dihydrofolate reductase